MQMRRRTRQPSTFVVTAQRCVSSLPVCECGREGGQSPGRSQREEDDDFICLLVDGTLLRRCHEGRRRQRPLIQTEELRQGEQKRPTRSCQPLAGDGRSAAFVRARRQGRASGKRARGAVRDDASSRWVRRGSGWLAMLLEG